MRYSAYIFLIFLIAFGCEKSPNRLLKSDVNLHVENGVTMYMGKPFSGNIVTYHNTNALAYSCTYNHGRKHGKEEKWYVSGVLAMERFYNKGIKIGLHKGWWPNKNRKFEFYFNDKGAYQGTMKEWFEDGTLYRDFHYANGKEEGSQKLYQPNGNIRANYVVKDGERFGLIGLKKCDAISTM